MKKRKRWRKEKEKSLESTVASGMTGGGLSAQEGSLLRSCMFGSIQYVHVVNMKAGILYAQQKQIQRRNRRACFLFSSMILMVHSWFTRKRDKDTNQKQMWLWHWFKHSPTFYVRSTRHENKNDRRSDYTYAQEYKEEIQRVIEETRQHVSRWRLYPLRGFSTHFDKVINDLLNFGWFPFLNPSICSKNKTKKKKQQKHKLVVWTVLQNCLCTAETAHGFRCSCA